ncbi:MAG: clostripain-related cysteine peptidase [Candidatus Wallbacteria bacterium]|nr:clostripain-related cysteine peptidase [Candidatus Wallbacteria bacterium]
MKNKIFFFLVLLLSGVVSRSAGASESDKAQNDWTIMMDFTSDAGLVELMESEINNLEEMMTGNNLTVLIQYEGPEKNDSVRYTIRHDENTNLITSPKEEIGEINSGDVKSLKEFFDWSVEKAPADHYCFLFYCHGCGFAKGTGRGICFDADDPGEYIDALEMKEFAEHIRNKIGRKIDLLAFNACLMSNLEAQLQFSECSDYGIASEPVMLSCFCGQIAGMLPELSKNPSLSGSQLGMEVIKGTCQYINQNHLSNTCAPGYIFSLIDYAALASERETAICPAMDRLAKALRKNLSTEVELIEKAFNDCEKYFFPDKLCLFSDLGTFCQGLSQSAVPEIVEAAVDVKRAIKKSVTYLEFTQNEGEVIRACGLSFFTPGKTSGYYNSSSYSQIELGKKTDWDEFMTEFLVGSRKLP